MKTIGENQAAFNEQRAELMETNPGEWVLFYEAELVELFPSFGEALDAGFARYGLESVFLIDQLIDPRPAFVFSPRRW